MDHVSLRYEVVIAKMYREGRSHSRPWTTTSNAMCQQVDVTSESDIFFFYYDEVDEEEFNKRRVEQKLTLEYCQYATVLTQLLNGCTTDPQTQHAILTIEDDGQRACLDFIKVAYCLHPCLVHAEVMRSRHFRRKLATNVSQPLMQWLATFAAST